MRENQDLYCGFGDFAKYDGGYQSYCDLVDSNGFFAEGNAEMAASADCFGRHLLVFGQDVDHDAYFPPGGLALGAPVALGEKFENPLLICHWLVAAHFTAVPIDSSILWKAPRNSKKARMEEIRLSNEAIQVEASELLSLVVAQARAKAEGMLRVLDELGIGGGGA